MRALVCALALAAAPKQSAWPLTASELEGESANNNPRIDDSPPCTGKLPVELRLFARVKDGPQVRLTVKNCTGKAVKLLHDVDLQPSRVDFKAKLKAPFDERWRRKFDNTVRTRSFLNLEPGTERLLMDEKLKREGEGYALRWGPFEYEAIPLGKQTLHAVLDAWLDSAIDEESGKSVKVENAAVGSFKSNDVTIALP
jgi:hypothetical protein